MDDPTTQRFRWLDAVLTVGRHGEEFFSAASQSVDSIEFAHRLTGDPFSFDPDIAQQIIQLPASELASQRLAAAASEHALLRPLDEPTRRRNRIEWDRQAQSDRLRPAERDQWVRAGVAAGWIDVFAIVHPAQPRLRHCETFGRATAVVLEQQIGTGGVVVISMFSPTGEPLGHTVHLATHIADAINEGPGPPDREQTKSLMRALDNRHEWTGVGILVDGSSVAAETTDIAGTRLIVAEISFRSALVLIGPSRTNEASSVERLTHLP